MRWRDREIDLADQAGRQSFRNPVPGHAAVDGLEQAAFILFTARDDRPRLALGLPGGREDDVRIAGQELEVRESDRVGNVEHTLPVATAIDRLVDAALFVCIERLADRRYPYDVVIRRVDLDRADLPDILEPDVLPAHAAIDRLVHALAGDDVAAQTVGAGADVDDVRVVLRDADVADRGRVEKPVGHVVPGRAVVLGLPDATAGRAEIESCGGRDGAGHCRDPAAARRADVAIFEVTEVLRE